MANYITVEEMNEIIDVIESAKPLWVVLTKQANVTSSELQEFAVDILDVNGERLGTVAWGDVGPAFYPLDSYNG